MKTFNSIKMILLSLFLGLSFTACDDNDNPENQSGSNLRINKILYDNGDKVMFYYNNQNQLDEVKYNDNTYLYRWNSNNTIEIERTDGSGQKNGNWVISLEHGRIASFSGDKEYETKLSYNANGQLVKAIKTLGEGNQKDVVFNYTWENGNTTLKETEGEKQTGEKFKYVYHYTYDTSMKATSLCFFFNDFILKNLFSDFGELFVVVSNPKLIGKEMANSVKNISSKENEKNCDIFKTYEYNKKEYPTRVTGRVKEGNKAETLRVYEVVWEEYKK